MNPENPAPQFRLPTFEESPLEYLQVLAQSPPSPDALSLLAGVNVTGLVKGSADLSYPYLLAVARHLPADNAATNRTRTFREAESSQNVAAIVAVRKRLSQGMEY